MSKLNEDEPIAQEEKMIDATRVSVSIQRNERKENKVAKVDKVL